MHRILVVFACVCAFAASFSAAEPASYQKDLLGPARAAMTGFMVKCPDVVPGHPELQRSAFACMVLPKPVVGHGQWDWGDCTSRAIEDWFWLREMTGDEAFGRDMEQAQQAALLWILTPDAGMACVPDRSKPQQGVYHYQMWDQGRTLRALVHWWQIEKNPPRRAELEQRLNKMIASLSSRARHGTDPNYGNFAVYPQDDWTGDQPGHQLMCMRGGQLIEPLAVYWSLTHSPSVRQFLDELVAGVQSGREGEGYPDPGSKSLFTFGENGSFNGHFHVHASTALGIARLGTALCRSGEREKGLDLLRWAKKVYDWTLSPENVNAGSTWGWFPENMSTGNKLAREVSEVCCVADMIEFAAALAEAAELDPALANWDALWDHVERYTLNSIIPTQFFLTDAYRRTLAQINAARKGIDNGYVRFEMDAAGCFNHESAGCQILGGADRGGLSQAVYGLEYAGKRAYLERTGRQKIDGKGIVTRTPSALIGNTIRGITATDDGKLRIENEAVCGQGPYVLRRFIVVNESKERLPQVRLMYAVNLDWTDWEQNIGHVDARTGWATVTSSTSPGVMGMSTEPKSTFTDVGDAADILTNLSRFNWSNPRESCTNNAAVAVGWDLGPLEPGESKSVTATLAVGANSAELERALSHEIFPDRSGESGMKWDLTMADKLTGSWYACFLPNDAAGPGPDGQPNTSGMACCSYSGPRGLYACWKPAICDDGQSVAVRLPVNRKDKYVFQDVTEGAEKVVQRIELSAARSLRVRIPDWASLDAVEVRNAGVKVFPFRTDRRWIDLGQQPAGTNLTVSYPLTARITKERVGGSGDSIGFAPSDRKRTFTATWRGNRLVAIDPPGQILQLFPTH